LSTSAHENETAAAMRLRPDPPSVTRLSRKVLTGLGLVAGLGLGGALIYALQVRHSDQSGEELFSTANRTPADGLAMLPKDYTEVPKKKIPELGPPLPGDLGKPILSAKTAVQPVSPGIDSEEQRRLQEMEAARMSRLFSEVTTAIRSVTPDTAQNQQTVAQQTQTNTGLDAATLAALNGQTAQPTLDPNALQNMQDQKLAFLTAPVDRRTISDNRLTKVPSPYVLQAGSVIPAALITGIRSDLPGQITAQVTENIYDSPTGKFLLLPQGSRLIGEYDSGISFGQSRVLLVWNRVILPSGKSIVLERQPGADTEGYAGLEDQVDYHWDRIFKAALVSTLLGVGANLGSNDEESEIVQALRQGASESANQAGQQYVERQMNVQPTLTIRPGFPVRVMVTRDLVLEEYREDGQ
jgi:type IV secretion system protein VirB10